MSDEPLKPALTPDEWHDEDTGEAGSGLYTYDVYSTPVHEMVADIAVLNYRLPADSPYKITREAVDVLALALNDLPRADEDDRADYARAVQLIAALRALLPPSGDTP